MECVPNSKFRQHIRVSIDLKWPIFVCRVLRTLCSQMSVRVIIVILLGSVYLQGRIKKIMQSDEEVGKVAQAVPIIIYILFSINLATQMAIALEWRRRKRGGRRITNNAECTAQHWLCDCALSVRVLGYVFECRVFVVARCLFRGILFVFSTRFSLTAFLIRKYLGP